MLQIFPFKWTPPSVLQWRILTWWVTGSPIRSLDGIIAEGAIRSGKTAPMSLSFVLWAMSEYNANNFILAGKTIGSLRRNVLAPLKRMLIGRGMKFIDHRADNMLEVSYLGHINYFYLFGGKDESSQDLVQGITAAGAYFDEVALQPESFVNQATGRCSADGAKLWFNCNPGPPGHWFKKNWVDKAKDLGLYLLHFLMDDNPSLTEATKARYKKLFPPGTVFFGRYIQGLWIMAEGAIYPSYAEALIDPKEIPDCETHLVGCDYGAANPFVYLLLGKSKSDNVWYVLKEWYEENKTPHVNSQYTAQLGKFLGDIHPRFVDCDHEPAFIHQLRNEYPQMDIRYAIKDVLMGIQHVAQMLYSGRLRISRNCPKLIDEMAGYVWDSKAQEKGEDAPLKVNDHACDALRYATMRIKHVYG